MYLGLDNDTGELMAVKQLGLSKKGVGGRVTEHEAAVREVEKEVNFYRRLNHPNIVRYLVCRVQLPLSCSQHAKQPVRRALGRSSLHRAVSSRASLSNAVQGTERTDDQLDIFLEFVPGGSIASLLEKFGALVLLPLVCG